jgi:MFS transporter, PAT family, beta-lactamase induction signal transducer AmpG
MGDDMAETENKTGKRNPGLWVPTLYFTEGFPYTTVLDVSNVFFKSIGASLETIGIFQGILSLPWLFKFIWSPLVDLFGTKRVWILVMQGFLAAAFIALTISIARPLSVHTASPAIVMLNLGNIWANGGFMLGVLLLIFSIGFGIDSKRPAAVRVFCAAMASAVITLFIVYHSIIFVPQTIPPLSTTLWFVLLIFLVTAFSSATHDISIDGYYLDALDAKAQASYSGVRVMFYRVSIIAGSGLIVMLAGIMGKTFERAIAEGRLSLPIPAAQAGWAVGIGFGALAFLILYLFHIFYLPKCSATPPTMVSVIHKSVAEAFTSYLAQKRIILIFLFLVLFKVDDYLWTPMSKPFLMEIGVSVTQIGFLQGVLGVVGAILGGILGGIYISKRGLTRSLWVLGIIHSLNQFLYAWLAFVHPVLPQGNTIAFVGLLHVGTINFLENLASGLGTIAFVNFIMRTCKKEYTATHYAIATGIMALSRTLAFILSGFIAKKLGWMHYFLFCFCSSIPALAVLAFLPLKELEARE